MAITIPAGNSFLLDHEAQNSGVAPNKAFATTLTAGSTLVACGRSSVSGDTLTVSDSSGGGNWTAFVTASQSALSVAMGIWYKANVAGGNTPTVTLNGVTSASGSGDLFIVELVGAAATPADGSNSGQAQNSPSQPDSGALNTTANGAVIGFLTTFNTSNPGAGTNYTIGNHQDTSGLFASCEYNLSATSGTNDATWAPTSESYWVALGAAFKAAATGATKVTMTGPTSPPLVVMVNTPAVFTFGVDQTPITGTLVVTPASNKAGTWSPTTVSLTTGAPSGTATFTPSATGIHTISETNNGSLTDAATIAMDVEVQTPYNLPPQLWPTVAQ